MIKRKKSSLAVMFTAMCLTIILLTGVSWALIFSLSLRTITRCLDAGIFSPLSLFNIFIIYLDFNVQVKYHNYKIIVAPYA